MNIYAPTEMAKIMTIIIFGNIIWRNVMLLVVMGVGAIVSWQHKSLASELREILVSIVSICLCTGSSHNIHRKTDWVNKFPAKSTTCSFGFLYCQFGFLRFETISGSSFPCLKFLKYYKQFVFSWNFKNVLNPIITLMHHVSFGDVRFHNQPLHAFWNHENKQPGQPPLNFLIRFRCQKLNSSAIKKAESQVQNHQTFWKPWDLQGHLKGVLSPFVNSRSPPL